MSKPIQILDQFGKPVKRSLSAYNGADNGRIFGNWPASRGDADSTLSPDRASLVHRTRERLRNDPLLSGAIKKLVDNVIGSGIRVESELDEDYLGISEQEARDLEIEIDAAWEEWCEEADYSGNQSRRASFYEIQRVEYLSEKTTGETIVIPRMVERPGYEYSFCLQVIETDRLMNPSNVGVPGYIGFGTVRLENGNEIRDGVEVGKRGETVAYWLANRHPGSGWGWETTLEFTRVPAVNRLGEASLWHNYTWHRPEATRGEPGFAAILAGARQLGDYIRNTATQAELASMFGLLITQQASPTDTDFGIDDPDNMRGTTAERAREQIDLYNGMVRYLQPGDDVKTMNPNVPGAQFDSFVERISTLLGAPLGLTRELMLNTFDKSNFSNTRLSLEESRRGFRAEQERFAAKHILPVRARVIHEAWLRGRLRLPRYRENPGLYLGCRLLPQAWPYMEPVKDIEAAARRIASGMSTLQEECAKQGKNWRKVADQRRREIVYYDTYQIPQPDLGAKATAPEVPENNGENTATQTEAA